MSNGRAEYAAAILAGQQAARDGQPVTACPHNLNADAPRQRNLARLWIRGYDRVNPAPVDYSG